jgi:hypothetical protein
VFNQRAHFDEAFIEKAGRSIGFSRSITASTRRAAGVSTRKRASIEPSRQGHVDHFIHVADRFLQRDQVPLLLGNSEPDQFGLRPLKISVRLTARRLPSFPP